MIKFLGIIVFLLTCYFKYNHILSHFEKSSDEDLTSFKSIVKEIDVANCHDAKQGNIQQCQTLMTSLINAKSPDIKESIEYMT